MCVPSLYLCKIEFRQLYIVANLTIQLEIKQNIV